MSARPSIPWGWPHPSSGTYPWPSTAWSGSSLLPAWPIPSTMEPPCWSKVRLSETAANLGPDAAAYRRLMGPLVAGWQGLLDDLLGPLRVPRHPLLMARFGLVGLLPAVTLARVAFRGERARAVLAGMASHAMMPLIEAGYGCLRAGACPGGSRDRLAHGSRRLAAHRRRAGRPSSIAGRTDHHRPSRALNGRPAGRSGHPV